MPSRNIQDCDPILQAAWPVACTLYEKKYPNASQPFLTCTHRTEAEQAALYAQGRTKPGKIVTQLKKGSKHNLMPSKAFDIAFKKADESLDWSSKNFMNFGAIIKEIDTRISHGGDWKKFKDLPHFEI